MAIVDAILKGVMIVCDFLTEECPKRELNVRRLDGRLKRNTQNPNLCLYYR